MAKILTGVELAKLVWVVVNPKDPAIDDVDQYEEFIKDLAGVLTKHFGGRVGLVQWVDELDDMTVAISNDGNIPEGGGIYKDYDKDGEL